MLGLTRNVGDIVAEIKMSRTSSSSNYLLVEGCSDSKFFRPKVLPEFCEIVICNSKPTLIQATKRIKHEKIATTLGIIDDDFDSALNIDHGCPDIIHTDTHDLETMMLASPALEKLLYEYADPEKLKALEEKEQCDFRACLIERALPFGYLRFINEMKKLNVSFEKRFSPWKYCDQSSWQIDKPRLFDDFASAANCRQKDINHFTKQLPKISAWNIIQGHDAMTILSIAMRSVLGSRQLPDETLCSALRLSFDRINFEKTKMYASIREWEGHRDAAILN